MRRRADPASKGRSSGRAALRPLLDLLWIGAFTVLCHGLLFNLSVVRGTSMAPGISDGDRVLVEDWRRSADALEAGQVVVLQSPVELGVDYIKRVVAVGGDEVLILDGEVRVNGERLAEDYAIPGSPSLAQWLRVRPGEVFVLGDNRPHSSDSREFGPVGAELVRGRVSLRVWPPARLGTLP